MDSSNIEYINKERIELQNSEEYKVGKKIIQIKKMLKKMQIIKLIKKTIRSAKIKKLSIKKDKYYDYIIKNDIDVTDKKIVIYSCVTGNYDTILEPLYHNDNIDYILYTDDENIKVNNWNIININKNKDINGMSLAEKNRYIKLNPYKLFKDKYDYAIYIDGNVQVVSDIRILINCINQQYGVSMHRHRNRDDIYNEYKVCKLLKKGNKTNLNKQIKRYKQNNFPKHYGMLECNIMIFDLKNINGEKITKEWYNEFNDSKSGRDQISLPYVLWKNNIKTKSIATMGSDVYKNYRFYIKTHKSGE